MVGGTGYGYIRRSAGDSLRRRQWSPGPFTARTTCVVTLPVYRLTSDEVKTANARSLSVLIPTQDFTPGNFFTKTTGLKSHDWKEVYSIFFYTCTCNNPV